MSKHYRLGADFTRASVSEAARALVARRRAGASREAFRALDDVSFAVSGGTALGVIGRNGAGKSTLLKILSRITRPTAGVAILQGRVGSLLEVGTGFHPDLTGRENTYMNAAMLGMRRAEVNRKLDAIVEFAEISRFLDTPVKRYSSGMYVRLAFSVAAHLEPEILLVDEVLAVGDVGFQRKCLGKMEDVAGQGRTVLFVSHNTAAIRQLTSQCLMLSNGRVAAFGPTDDVLSRYLSSDVGGSDEDVTHAQRWDDSLGHEARITRVRLIGDESGSYGAADCPKCEVTVEVGRRLDAPTFHVSVIRFDGTAVASSLGEPGADVNPGVHVYQLGIPGGYLAPGRYYIQLGFNEGDYGTGIRDLDGVLETVHFEVRPWEGADGTVNGWPITWGVVRLPRLDVQLL